MELPKTVTNKIGKRTLGILSWSLYDFANTIFSLNVISLYFALWVTVDKQGEDILYSIALSVSLVLSAILEPILGCISDILKKRMPFLIFFTVLCCLFTAGLSIAKTLFMGLVIFAIANLGYQMGSVFYNVLLAEVSESKNTGRISGLGTGLGYLGAIVGLVFTRPFVLRSGHQAAFIPTAILFLLFSLPCFLFVKETRAEKTSKSSQIALKQIFLRIKETFTASKSYPGLLRFLFATFIFLNAINTVIIFMAVYLRKVAGFSDQELITIFIISTLMAILGAFSFGFATDKLGPLRTTKISLLIWMATLLLVSLTRSKQIFWFVGPLMGVALGSIWTSSRTLAIRLCPYKKLGELFGLLGMVGKSSSIIGPLIWGLTVLSLRPLGDWKYRIAVLIQVLFIFLGWLIIKGIPRQD